MTKCPRCKTGNKVGPRIVTPEMHHDVVAEWCDNEGCEYWKERPVTPADYKCLTKDLIIQPFQQSGQKSTETVETISIEKGLKIIADFESIFGKLPATERRWLTRRMAGLNEG